MGGTAIGTIASPPSGLPRRVAGDGLPWPWEGEAFGMGVGSPALIVGKRRNLFSLLKIKKKKIGTQVRVPINLNI